MWEGFETLHKINEERQIKELIIKISDMSGKSHNAIFVDLIQKFFD